MAPQRLDIFALVWSSQGNLKVGIKTGVRYLDYSETAWSYGIVSFGELPASAGSLLHLTLRSSHRPQSQILVENRDFCRAMLCISAAYAVMRVCLPLCVCLSRSCIVSKRIKIFSIFFHRRIASLHHSSFFFAPNGMAILRREPP